MANQTILDLMPVGARRCPHPGLVAPSLAHQGRLAALQAFTEAPTRVQVIDAATSMAIVASQYPCHRAAIQCPVFMAEPLRIALWERNIVAVAPLTASDRFVAWVPLTGDPAVGRILRYLDGQSVRSISEKDGVSIRSIYRLFRKHEIKTGRRSAVNWGQPGP